MAGRRCFYGGSDGSNTTSSSLLFHSQRPESFFLSAPSTSLLGSKSMVSFQDGKRKSPYEGFFMRSYDEDEIGDEEYDEYFQQPEKKRRLKADQIQFLEKSFETDNKLEPERKVQLAKELGLQPRQVAIWFQNRRARWKTKTLEKDYDVLQNNYNSLKADYDNLLAEKEKLKAEVLDLTDKLLLKEDKGSKTVESDKQKVSAAFQQERVSYDVSVGEVLSNSVMDCKQEDHNSVRSDAVDSDSPRYSDEVYSSFMEPVDCSYVLESAQSDISQDEEDNLGNNLLFPSYYVFSKNEDGSYSEPPPNSSYFGFPVEEDHTFGFWGTEL